MDVLDLVVESFHEMSHNLTENILYRLVVYLCISDHVEMPYESCSYLGSSSSRWTKRSQYYYILYLHELLILPVVPSIMIQKLPQQLNRRLCPVFLLFWHVQIIHENHVLLTHWSPENPPLYLLQFKVNRILSLIRRRLRRKNYRNVLVRLIKS